MRKLWIFVLCVALATCQMDLYCYHTADKPGWKKLEVPVQKCKYISLIGSTHIDSSGTLVVPSEHDLVNFSRMKRYGDVRLILCLTSPNPTFSNLTASESLMRRFAQDVGSLLLKWNLDGIDIDWEFPLWSRDGTRLDRVGFRNLLRILKELLGPIGKLLTVAVSGPPTISRMYDVDALQKYADIVQVMNYDFHVFSRFGNPFVGFNAPLHPMGREPPVLNEMNSESSMKTWFSLGLSANKTFFGVPFYGRGYKLLLPFFHTPYAPAYGTTDEFTDYSAACKLPNLSGYKVVWNKQAASPYAYGNRQWISFENEESLRQKVKYAAQIGCKGVMVYSLGSDDYEGVCSGGKWPLLETVSEEASLTI